MSEVATVRPHLERRFDDHRVVFWHDPEGQYAADLDSLDLPGVQTVRVANDEYAIKNRLLHDEPEDKFLVYRSGQVPAGIGNWLLDLELAYGVFTADRTALVVAGSRAHRRWHRRGRPGPREVLQRDQARSEPQGAARRPRMTPTKLRAKMSAVVLGQRRAQPAGDHPHAAVENAKGQHAKYDALVDYGLDDFYWRGVASIYGYESASPEHRRLHAVDLPQGDRGLQVGPARRPPEHPARLRQPAQRPAQPGRPADAAQACGARPRLQDAPSRTRASATSSRSTCSRRPTTRSSATLPARSPSRPSPPAKSLRSCAPPEQRLDRRLPPALRRDRQRLRAVGLS